MMIIKVQRNFNLKYQYIYLDCT